MHKFLVVWWIVTWSIVPAPVTPPTPNPVEYSGIAYESECVLKSKHFDTKEKAIKFFHIINIAAPHHTLLIDEETGELIDDYKKTDAEKSGKTTAPRSEQDADGLCTGGNHPYGTEVTDWHALESRTLGPASVLFEQSSGNCTVEPYSIQQKTTGTTADQGE